MTKIQNTILKVLKANKNKYIKGHIIRLALRYKKIALSPLDFRKEIKAIRKNGYPIIANSTGYCFTTKKQWFDKYIEARRKELKSEAIILNTMKGLW